MKLFNLFLSLILTLGSLATPSPRTPVIRQIYTFPKNRFIENIAVRSNSDLLLTSFSAPTLFTLDPTASSPNVTILYTFPNSTGLGGITEISPDVFTIVSGVWDLANTRAIIGTLSIWTVNLRSPTLAVRHITGIVNSTIFNGLTRVPGSSKLVLAADSDIGAVWRVNIITGQYDIAFSDPLFAPVGSSPGSNLGINGIRAKGNFLYFTNSAQGFFGRVAINSRGDKVGTVEIVANMTASGGVYDDFAIDESGNSWIATHPDYVVKVKSSGKQKVIANETFLLNPTSAAFGRGGQKEKQTLYVTNGGVFSGTDLIDEGVVAIDTARV
jgi:hypothetical protein